MPDWPREEDVHRVLRRRWRKKRRKDGDMSGSKEWPIAKRCELAELQWLEELQRRPVTVDDYHARIFPHLSRDTCERRWERLKKKLADTGFPHEQVNVKAKNGYRSAKLALHFPWHRADLDTILMDLETQ